MLKPDDPRQLTIDLLARSVCHVQVAAVLADREGIFGWGWNSVGAGFGEHAEAAAVRRSNRKRLNRATIYVAAVRRGNFVTAKPCPDCQHVIRNVYRVVYRDAYGEWREQV